MPVGMLYENFYSIKNGQPQKDHLCTMINYIYSMYYL